MKSTESGKAWDGWSAIERLGLGRRTGRFAVFYDRHHHVFFDLTGGNVAAIYLSDRRLKIEHVMTRMGLISSDDVHRAFHHLETIDRITPLSHVLLAQGAMSSADLAAGRNQQMIEALQAVMISDREELMFIPGPVDVQKIEAVIRFEDVLASAFAAFRLDSSGFEQNHEAIPEPEDSGPPMIALNRKSTYAWRESTVVLRRRARLRAVTLERAARLRSRYPHRSTRADSPR
jgi:hypothetical protein